jgi:23S rRNA (uracil1939-C5)-methyltransferase
VKPGALSAGDIIEVTADRLAFGGEAVARHHGLAIFIPLAAPGERLRVRITQRKKTYARAAIQQILEPSPERREPPCPYFGECGGCQLQHLTYEAQLASKVVFVRDALERIGRIDWPHDIPIRHAAELGYRSRARIKIDPRTRRVGYNRIGSNSVCDVASCKVLVPELDAALSSLRAAVAGARKDDRGFAELRQVEIAAGASGVAFDPPVNGLVGGPLEVSASGAVYAFSPSTFFQANPLLLDVLIKQALGDALGDLAIDLYAGVGLFTIQLARRFSRVIGVEADSETAMHALNNIYANRAVNVEFHASQVESWLKRFNAKAEAPDFMVVDPPRTGAARSIPLIIELGPRRMSYVSCDPPTLARDLRLFIDGGYEISAITAIDLFPQTYHVETVVLLTRRQQRDI